MANGFIHKDLIKSLKENFVQYFNAQLSRHSFVKISWEFPQKEFEHAYISGYENERVKIIKTLFKVEKRGCIAKKIVVDLTEDEEGVLTVMVNGKLACSIEPAGRMSVQFLKSFAEAIKEEI